ncbi:hypothetical protein [Rhodococcus sp. Q1]|nr:hypothetical protein [Rhodococcus sp. Q1]
MSSIDVENDANAQPDPEEGWMSMGDALAIEDSYLTPVARIAIAS